MATVTRMGFVGLGGMARHHLRTMLNGDGGTAIEAICEPSDGSADEASKVFKDFDRELPPNEPDLDSFLSQFASRLDAVFITTPHALHYAQATKCLEAGLDVLVEKPMVMNGEEARALIETRDRTGRVLVVAFQGGLSPAIAEARNLLSSGALGKLLSISGTVWQGWGPGTVGTWRQKPEVSGGGFMFDTGAHMLNTVSDLAGEDFAQVAAWLDTRGRPVDVLATVMARLRSGAYVTIHGCGETTRSCASEIYVFCSEGIMRTGQWGERLEVQQNGDPDFVARDDVTTPEAWEVFVRVRNGEIPNPCPPEVGLRMAKLWDAIKASSAGGGAPVNVA